MVFSDFECLVKDFKNVGQSLVDFQELNVFAQVLIQIVSKIGVNASAFDVFKEMLIYG